MIRKIFFVSNIFVLFMMVCVFAQQTDTTSSNGGMDPQAATHYNNGVKFMQSGNFKDAAASFDSSLQITKSAKTYYQKGYALMKAQDMDGAKAAFQACLGIDSTNDNAYYQLGNIALVQKNFDEAVQDYQAAKRVTKNSAMLNDADNSIALAQQNKGIEFYNTGNELAKAGKFDEAIQNYDKSLAVAKDYKTYYQKGLTLLKANKPADAISALNSCIALNDTFDIAYIALAGAQTAAKDYEAANKNYEKALSVSKDADQKAKIQTGLTNNYILMGNTFLKEKKYDKAIDAFKKANENGEVDQAYLGLAKASIEKKKFDDALAALDKASGIKKTVTDGAISYYKGVIYMGKGDNAKAMENFSAGAKDPVYKKASESQIAYMKAKAEQDKQKKK